MIILMKCLNEERNIKRCLGNFHDEPFIHKVIVIDGGSTDYTVQELLQWKKVQVFIHPWLDWYHDAEVSQSNIALSYIPHGELAFIMDFDEKMSPELKKVLEAINTGHGAFTIPLGGAVNFSRRTFDLIRYEDSPHALVGEDGWPMISHQIGQYPDFQCRLIRRSKELHWVNSPHHVLLGATFTANIEADILHYEKDDFRDRERLERKWARAQARRIELGLIADIFETQAKPEVGSYYHPEGWKKQD